MFQSNLQSCSFHKLKPSPAHASVALAADRYMMASLWQGGSSQGLMCGSAVWSCC